MDKYTIIEKMMRYITSKAYIEDEEGMGNALLSILDNEEQDLVFNNDDAVIIYQNNETIEKAFHHFMSNALHKKNVKTNLGGHEVFLNISHYADEPHDSHINFILDLGLDDATSVVVSIPAYTIHQWIDIQTQRVKEDESWRRATRDMTDEEMDLGVICFMGYFFDAFQTFFQGIYPTVTLDLIKTTQCDEELEGLLPKGEVAVFYLGAEFDYKDTRAGETIQIVIPYTSIKSLKNF